MSALEPFVVFINIIVLSCLVILVWAQTREIGQLRRDRVKRFNKIAKLNRLERSRLIVEDSDTGGHRILDASLATLFDVAEKGEGGVLVKAQVGMPKRIRLETWGEIAGQEP